MLHDVIAAVSAQLVDSPTERTDEAIRSSLTTLVDALAADRLTLHLCGARGATRVYASAKPEGTEGDAPKLPLDSLPWLRGQLAKLDSVQLRIGSSLPPDAAAERVHICADRLVAWLLVPMIERGRVVGVLECRTHTVGAGWSREDVALLRVATDLVLSALRRQRDAERTRERERIEVIGRAAGGVAHDLNNFLTAILGYCDMLETDLGGAAREDVNEIRTAAVRAGGVVEQILGFARKSDDGDSASPSATAPALAVRKLESLLRRVAGDHIDLRFRLGDGVSTVRLREPEFDQLIVNLISNARDAMPEGGSVEISTERITLREKRARRLHVQAGDYLVLRVSDEGCGIDDETRERLFEPFFTTRARSGGTGLGLSTVASIVENARGAIEVESALGRGTCFAIWLPAAEPNIRASYATEPGSATVLLVESQRALRRLASRALHLQGYRVIAVEDAAQALGEADRYSGRIDLLVLDPSVPDPNGAAEELEGKLRERYPALQRLHTADVPSPRSSALPIGGGVGLAKPFTPRTLTRAVRQRSQRHPSPSVWDALAARSESASPASEQTRPRRKGVSP